MGQETNRLEEVIGLVIIHIEPICLRFKMHLDFFINFPYRWHGRIIKTR